MNRKFRGMNKKLRKNRNTLTDKEARMDRNMERYLKKEIYHTQKDKSY